MGRCFGFRLASSGYYMFFVCLLLFANFMRLVKLLSCRIFEFSVVG